MEEGRKRANRGIDSLIHAQAIAREVAEEAARTAPVPVLPGPIWNWTRPWASYSCSRRRGMRAQGTTSCVYRAWKTNC